MACKSAPESGKESLDECTCTICMCILIEPVTLPCAHELCMPCFKQTVEEANLTCPLCRTRISNWARKAAKNKALVDQKRWEQVRKLFPTKVQRRLDGLDDELDEDDLNDNEIDGQYRRLVHLSKPGEIRQEYEAELKKLAQRAEEERRKEEEASAALIQALENEYSEDRKLLQQIAEQDENLARELAESVDVVGANTPCRRVHKNSTSVHRNPLPGYASDQPDTDSSKNTRQHTKKLGNKTLQTFFRPLPAAGKAVAPKTHSSIDESDPIVWSPTQQNSQVRYEVRLQQRSASGPLVRNSSASMCESESLCVSVCEERAWEDEKTGHNVQERKGTDQVVDGNTLGLKDDTFVPTSDKSPEESVQRRVRGRPRLPAGQSPLCPDPERKEQQSDSHSPSRRLARLESSHLLLIDISSQAIGLEPVPEEDRKQLCPEQTEVMGSTWSSTLHDVDCRTYSQRKRLTFNKWQPPASVVSLCDEFSLGQPDGSGRHSVFGEAVGSLSSPASQVAIGRCLSSVPGDGAAGSPAVWLQQTQHESASAVNAKEPVTQTDLSSLAPCGPGQESSTTRPVGIFNPATVPEWSGGFYVDKTSRHNVNFSTKQMQNAEDSTSARKKSCVEGEGKYEVVNNTAVHAEAGGVEHATDSMGLEMSVEHQDSGIEDAQEEKIVGKPKGAVSSRRKTTATTIRSASADVGQKGFQKTNAQQPITNWLSPFRGESSHVTYRLSKQESPSVKRKALENRGGNFNSSSGVSPCKNRKDSRICTRLLHGVNTNLESIPNAPAAKRDVDVGEEELAQEERDYRFALEVQQQLDLADKLHLRVLRFKGSNDAYSLRKGTQHKYTG